MGDGRRLTTDRYFGDLDTRLSNLEVALETLTVLGSLESSNYEETVTSESEIRSNQT